jgi:hypothetical protein
MTPAFRIFLIATFFSLLLLPGAINAQHKNGGSCSYWYAHSPAVVLYFYPKGETYTEIVFSVNTGNGTDTVSYSSINHWPVPNDTVKKYNIHRGDVLTLETGHIYTGSCNPLIRRFKLQTYKPDLEIKGDEKPCTYTKAVDEAYVISVVPVEGDSAAYEIYFRIINTRIDTVSYSQVNNRFVSSAEIKKYNIKQGDSLTYVENFINTGSCEPYTREIIFETYERKKKTN